MPSPSESSGDEEEHVRDDAEDEDDGAASGPLSSAPVALGLTTRYRVTVESAAAASELYVVDRSYALVAKGVGRLSMDLEAGRYKVRQRIGDSEHVVELAVLEGSSPTTVTLPPLSFPTPLPLPGTSLLSGSPGPLPFAFGSGNFRFVLRTPVGADVELTPEQVDRIHRERDRLRLEKVDGSAAQQFNAPGVSEYSARGTLTVSLRLQPGTYLVVQQRTSGRQACMPVVVCEGMTTAVFCLALSDEGQEVPMGLRHAAIAILRDVDLKGGYEASLLRLEAARKAMAAGRQMFGWASDSSLLSVNDGAQPENVLLDLMDAYLGWRCLNPRSTDRGERLPDEELQIVSVDMNAAWERLERAASVLGWSHGDIVAIAHALRPTDGGLNVAAIKDPPLLRRCWEQLLSFETGNAQAGAVMPFPFQVEPSSTWFIWSEEPGCRAASIAEATGSESRRTLDGSLEVLRPGGREIESVGGGVLTTIGGLSVSNPVKELLTFGLKVMKDVFVQRLPRMRRDEAPVVTFKDVQAMVAALLADKSFQEWLNRANAVLVSDDKAVKDESLKRLIAGLRSWSDPALLETLGADAVATQVLAALRLPQSRVVQLVKELLTRVVARLDSGDKAAVLSVLDSVVAAAEAWLQAPPDLPKKQ